VKRDMSLPEAPTSLPPFLAQPLPTLAAWTAHFQRADVPVLDETAEMLEGLRRNEDAVDANLLGEALAGDPLMSLKVLAHVALHRSPRAVTDAETVTAALVLLGIGPFFRHFGAQPTVEQHLAAWPEALQGLRGVLRRSERSARFALGFAVHRRDHDAALIHEAALLHDFAEMLMWCHAPALALEMQRRQAADPALRSAQVQQDVLHIRLADLQQSLMQAWHLPEMLVHIADDRRAQAPAVRNVLLAVRLARHSAAGWDNAALRDDYADLADLLHLGIEPTRELVHELDA
jgi:HD-like signal output (HDOD) protein